MHEPIGFFVVADGMGGHAGGAVASKLAIEVIEKTVNDNFNTASVVKPLNQSPKESPLAKLLSDSLRNASKEVYQMSVLQPSLKGMGTTATALLIQQHTAYIAHVGDSRAYLIRDKKITQISEDHSLVQEQLKAGLISLEQARSSRFRNIITRSIGYENDVDVDMAVLPVQEGDIFVLCTDGLNTLLSDEEIMTVILDSPLDLGPKVLIDLANQRGGDDNITVIIVKALESVDVSTPGQ